MRLTDWLQKLYSFGRSMSAFQFHFAEQRGVKNVDALALLKRNQSYVYACAQLNASMCASVPLKLYARGGSRRFSTRALAARERLWLKSGTLYDTDDAEEIVDPEHPLRVLLQSANPAMTGIELRELKFLHQELTGDAFHYIETAAVGGRSVPVALYPLRPDLVRVVPDDETIVKGYLYGKDDNNVQRYDKAEVIHYKYPNPIDLLRGLGPLQAAVAAADRIAARSAYVEALYSNNARPDFVIQYKGQLSDSARRVLYEDWNRTFRGVKKSGRPVLLDQDGSIQTLGFSPKEAELSAAADMDKAEIAAAFGVPLTLLEMSDSNKASALAGETGYLKRAIVPRLMRDQEKLNEELCPLFDERLFVAYENPVPDDVELDVRRHSAYVAMGAMSVNEVRAEIGMDPIPDGDLYRSAPQAPPPAALPDGAPENPDSPKAFPAARCTCRPKSLDPPLDAGEQRIAEAARRLLRQLGERAEEQLGRP